MIKYQAGTIDPSEYNWEEQFSFEDEMEPFITMDVGKVRGLAIALERSEAEVVEVYTNALAIGERRGMERAADMVAAQAILSDFPYEGKLMAEKIRKGIKKM